MEDKQRTLQQNRALHKWCAQVARVLNESGKDMKVVLKPEVDIPWTTYTVKDHLWKPILQIMLGKESTTEMNTVDPTQICETITRHIGQSQGVVLPPWPSVETQHLEHLESYQEKRNV